MLSASCATFNSCGPVAQLDRASDFGSEGWGFDSLRGRQYSLWRFQPGLQQASDLIPARVGRPSNSFRLNGNSYRGRSTAHSYFQPLANGKKGAILLGRRSGAQRGALENNFGQRFSWAPLAFSGPSLKSLRESNQARTSFS